MQLTLYISNIRKDIVNLDLCRYFLDMNYSIVRYLYLLSYSSKVTTLQIKVL